MNKSSGVDVKSEGLLAKGPTEQRGRSKEKKKDSGRSKSKSRGAVACYYCKKKGHIKKNCRKLKADQEKKAESTSTAGVATENKPELLSVSSGKPNTDLWVLDSGCSFHMCANRDWFDTYERKDGGERGRREREKKEGGVEGGCLGRCDVVGCVAPPRLSVAWLWVGGGRF